MSWLYFLLWDFVPFCNIRPSISGIHCLQNICGDYAAEHEITIYCKKNGAFLSRSMDNLLHQMFFWIVYVYNYLTKSNILVGVLLNASLKDDDDDDDIQRQVKSLHCAGNKLRGIFVQYSPAVKKHCIPCLLHANLCLAIVKQIRTDIVRNGY